MYSVDEQDEVVELDNVPQSDIGAPMPFILCDERTLLLFYLTGNEVLHRVSVNFELSYQFMFGVPNDEAFDGHPLASRGLEPYGAFQVKQSSWIRQLERMNSVHPHHDPAHFDKLNHYVFAFHDTTFECVAEGFTISIDDPMLKEQFIKFWKTAELVMYGVRQLQWLRPN